VNEYEFPKLRQLSLETYDRNRVRKRKAQRKSVFDEILWICMCAKESEVMGEQHGKVVQEKTKRSQIIKREKKRRLAIYVTFEFERIWSHFLTTSSVHRIIR